MTFARIYRPAKTAMQSGRANTKQWLLEFTPQEKKRVDPLMGWTSSGDTLGTQVKLKFDTKDAAIDYARRHGIPFRVMDQHERGMKPKSYASNFAYNRKVLWTH